MRSPEAAWSNALTSATFHEYGAAMTFEELTAYIASQDLEARVYYGFGADAVAMHPEDAKLLNASSLLGMTVYVDEDLAPGEPEIVSPWEAMRRYGDA